DFLLEAVLPASAAILAAGTDEEKAQVRARLSLLLSQVAQRILDADVRARWFRSPQGRMLTSLAGPASLTAQAEAGAAGGGFSEKETRMLGLVAEGLNNAEIAAQAGIDEDGVGRQLGELFVKMGASSRA